MQLGPYPNEYYGSAVQVAKCKTDALMRMPEYVVVGGQNQNQKNTYAHKNHRAEEEGVEFM